MSDKKIANSPHCIKSELDLFYVPPTNTSIESGGWGVFHPVSVIVRIYISKIFFKFLNFYKKIF